jgi:hypothetical protein
MRALTAHDLLAIWESGEGRHPVDQALAILAAACPEKSWQELAALDLGRRDGLLLALHTRSFGPQLEGFAACPACSQELEFNLPQLPGPEAEAPPEGIMELDGYRIAYRLPDSFDLAAAASSPALEDARAALLKRLVGPVSREGADVPLQALPSTAISALGEQLVEHSPLLELLLELQCPACGQRWTVLLDIAAFLWSEIASRARRLLQEVHLLARAYGWSEAQILALSARRRKMYMQMVMG